MVAPRRPKAVLPEEAATTAPPATMECINSSKVRAVAAVAVATSTRILTSHLPTSTAPRTGILLQRRAPTIKATASNSSITMVEARRRDLLAIGGALLPRSSRVIIDVKLVTSENFRFR